ncbi:MAG: ABC transporter permease, partial [Thermoplasmata archaeon]|nr:ABC transporter permease [Thermoplasmata archaeon]
MIILLKKAVRDLLRSKMRTLSIILAIALSISLGIGLVNATRDALESFDKRLDDTNYEDIDIQFDMSEIDLDEIGAIDGVDQVSGRIFLETQAQYGEERYKAHWIASPYMEGKPYALINGYQITDGNPFSSPLSGECLVGSLFAGGNDLKIGEEVTIYADNITIPLTVSGIAASPEYIYVVSDTGWPEPALLMPLFTTYETAITELNLTGSTFNEVLITVKPGYEPDEVKAEVVTYLTGNGIRVTRSLLGTEELDYQFSRTDASAMGHMGWVFGVIILAVTAVVIYNSLARLIASQRPYIGVMGALGGRKIDIILHYCLFGALMGAVGAVIGVPLGMGMSYLIVIAYASVIGLIDPVTTIFWIYPLIFGSIGILISTLGAFLGSLKAVSIGPRAALTSQYSSQDFSNKPILERLFDIVAYRRPILPRIPLRNLSRHKVRTTITMISLAFSFLLVFTCLTMALSFTQPVEDNYEKYETWDLKALMIERVDILDAETLLTGPEFMDTGAEVTLDDFAPII